MSPILVIALAIAAVVAVVHLARVLGSDGYGHTPPPRSHRDEEPLTQHERLRRLAR